MWPTGLRLVGSGAASDGWAQRAGYLRQVARQGSLRLSGNCAWHCTLQQQVDRRPRVGHTSPAEPMHSSKVPHDPPQRRQGVTSARRRALGKEEDPACGELWRNSG